MGKDVTKPQHWRKRIFRRNRILISVWNFGVKPTDFDLQNLSDKEKFSQILDVSIHYGNNNWRSTKLDVSSNDFNVWENGQNIQIENFWLLVTLDSMASPNRKNVWSKKKINVKQITVPVNFDTEISAVFTSTQVIDFGIGKSTRVKRGSTTLLN